MFTIYESGVGSRTSTPRKRSSLAPAEQLHRDVQAHRMHERAALTEIERATDLAATPASKFILGLLEDSTSRQLAVVERMDASLNDALHWTRSANALPDLTVDRERHEAVQAIKGLLKLERERARSARRLAKKYADIDGGFERALVEVEADSSEGNVRLLRLLLDRFARPKGAAVESIWRPALRRQAIAAPPVATTPKGRGTQPPVAA